MSTRIVVVGSSNTDMVIKTQQLPGPGETVTGGSFFMAGGGKGANQAVAAARLGGHVTFVARTGKDLFGQTALTQFQKENIDTTFVQQDAAVASGIALILVNAVGENAIAVASGANALLTNDDVDQAIKNIEEADIILVQLEIPLDVVSYLCKLAAGKNKRLVLNPAPAPETGLPADLLRNVYCITPNETEAKALTGIVVYDMDTATRAAAALAETGPEIVIVTMGKQGALIFKNGTGVLVAAPVVSALDTTAAGDVFNGALAVALAEGKDPGQAVLFANYAAGLSVTRLGAQPSAPFRNEVEDFLERSEKKY